MFIENETVWETLKKESRPIVLYGMGNASQKIISVLNRHNIKVSDIFASDEFVREKTFCNFKIQKYSDIAAKYDDFVILVCFATFLPDMLDKIKMLNDHHTLYAPYISMFGDEIVDRDFLSKHKKAIEDTQSLFADEESRKCYQNIINYMITGKVSYLFHCQTDRSEVFSKILPLSSNETYLDLGAYDGDTLLEFLSLTHCRYEKIIALEPDGKNYKKLCKTIEEYQIKNAKAFPVAVWKEKTTLTFDSKGGRMSSVSEKGNPLQAESIDSLLQGQRVTYIKMDVEGVEYEALMGGKETISAFSPKLSVSAYHRICDLFTLPHVIKELNPNYQIFLRHHPYIPAFETNLYAAPC